MKSMYTAMLGNSHLHLLRLKQNCCFLHIPEYSWQSGAVGRASGAVGRASDSKCVSCEFKPLQGLLLYP